MTNPDNNPDKTMEEKTEREVRVAKAKAVVEQLKELQETRNTKLGTSEYSPTRTDTPAERLSLADEEVLGKWDSLLTSEAKPEETYVQPNVELELSATKRNECRDILREIKDFGVSQRQMLYLIYLMGLEFEHVDVVRTLSTAVGECRQKVKITIRDKMDTAAVTQNKNSSSSRLIIDDKND